MVDTLLTKPVVFSGAMGSKKGCINLYFVSVVVFKLSQKNGVSLLFSELRGEGCAVVAVWLKGWLLLNVLSGNASPQPPGA